MYILYISIGQSQSQQQYTHREEKKKITLHANILKVFTRLIVNIHT